MARRARVLVTRPEPGASQTVARLESLGFEAVKLPLQETRAVAVDRGVIAVGGRPPLRHASRATSPPFDGGEEGRRGTRLPSSTPQRGGEADRPQGETEWGNSSPKDVVAVAFPSASAIRHAPSELLARLAELPCFAVGEATAQVAREAGFTRVVVADGDAESLAAMIVANPPPGAVAYLCGRVRRSVFESRLTQAGIPVIVVETYDTLGLDLDADGMSSVEGAGDIDAALVYSASAAARLASLVTEPEMRGRCANTVFICISDRVAQELAGPEFAAGRKILVAGEPNETALLKVLGAAVRPAS